MENRRIIPYRHLKNEGPTTQPEKKNISSFIFRRKNAIHGHWWPVTFKNSHRLRGKQGQDRRSPQRQSLTKGYCRISDEFRNTQSIEIGRESRKNAEGNIYYRHRINCKILWCDVVKHSCVSTSSCMHDQNLTTEFKTELVQLTSLHNSSPLPSHTHHQAVNSNLLISIPLPISSSSSR